MHQAPHFESPFDALPNFEHVERFVQIVVCATFHGLDRRMAVATGGDKDHRQLGVKLANVVENLQSRRGRQHHVEQHHVGPFTLERLQSFITRSRTEQTNIAGLEGLLNEVPYDTVIVDDQNFRHPRSSVKTGQLRRHG